MISLWDLLYLGFLFSGTFANVLLPRPLSGGLVDCLLFRMLAVQEKALKF